MKILSRFVFFILFFTSSLFSATATGGSGGVETQFTKGVNKRDKCAVECPPLKEGFVSRILSFSYETGDTVCNVYSTQNPTKAIGIVTNKNSYCAKDLVNPNATSIINSNTSGVNSALASYKSQIHSLHTKTGDSTYVNLPKYMVAGLMADNDIIDISSSITNNEISLNGGYTLYPNLVFGGSDNYLDQNLLSRTKDALAGSVTFVINFMSASDKILMSFKVALFLFVVALSLIFMLTQKGTKKVSGIGDHEDFTEKILFGVLSIIIFFLPLNKISTPTGDISQTGYQQLIRPLLYLGVETADKLSVEATSSYLKYKFSETGYVATQDLNSYKNQLHKLEIIDKTYREMIPNWCNATYKTKELRDYNKLLGFNTTFPPSEEIFTKGYGGEEKRAVVFYTKDFLTSEGLLLENNIPTVSFCHKIERSILENNTRMADLKLKIKAYESVTPEMEKRLNSLSGLIMKNNAEFGFVGLSGVVASSLAMSNIDFIGKSTVLTEAQNPEKAIKDYRNATGYEVGSVQGNDGWFDELVYSFITEAPYYMLPFSSSIKGLVDSSFPDSYSFSASDIESSGFFTGLMKGAWNYTGGIALDMAMPFVKAKLVLYILTLIVDVAPIIGMIGASFLVMSFYFLSILILYIVIPFACVFAFSTGNLDIIKNLIKHTFLLSIKPVLIVVSILMALFVFEMFQSFNSVVVASIFEPLFYLSNDETNSGVSAFFNISSAESAINAGSSLFKGFGFGMVFLFLKGVMLMVGSLITVVVCFYLVFNGANIILDLLGMRDGGFDVGGVIGDKVESKQHGNMNLGV